MQPHREVGGVLFRLRLGPWSHIPDDEVKRLRSSTFRRMSLSQVRHSICPDRSEKIRSHRFWNPRHLVFSDGIVVYEYAFGERYHLACLVTVSPF